MIYEYVCSICSREFVERISVENRDKVWCCDQRAQRIVVQLFNTDPDRAYSGLATFTKEPVHLRSKKHYRNLLKQEGLVDCSPKEGHQEADFKRKGIDKKIADNRMKKSENLYGRLKAEGLHKHIGGAMKWGCSKDKKKIEHKLKER